MNNIWDQFPVRDTITFEFIGNNLSGFAFCGAVSAQQPSVLVLESYNLSGLKESARQDQGALFRTDSGVFCLVVNIGDSMQMDCNWDYFNERNRNKMTGQWYNGVSPFLTNKKTH